MAAALLLFLLAGLAAAAGRGFPRPVGYVNDFAGVLDPAQKRLLESYLSGIEVKSGAEIVVVTLDSIGDTSVDEAANLLYEQWRIGKRGKDRGVLLLDAIQQRRVRIEVGYGLEGAIPDGKAGEIRDRYLVPFLREGRRFEGYSAALHEIAAIALREAGLDPALADSLSVAAPPQRRSERRAPPLAFIIVAIIIAILWSSMTSRGRRGGGGFWYGPGGFGSFGGFGGFGGGSGGGGGFGGFGGGGSGGGGASGGY